MSVRLFLLFLCLAFCFPLLAIAGAVQIPRTGQTTSYIAGDDGDKQSGVAWPNPRFVDNNNGTVTDNLTGLIWLKNANCFGGKDWQAAIISANTLTSGTCGLSDGSSVGDWRVPNRTELKSLFNRQQVKQQEWLPTVGFINVENAWYWTSSACVNHGDYAWYANLQAGIIMCYGNSILNKSYGMLVWPVRGGQ